MKRLLSSTTIHLVKAMVENPSYPKPLREFHRKQLADLQRRMELQQKPKRESPFSRFVDRLGDTDQTL